MGVQTKLIDNSKINFPIRQDQLFTKKNAIGFEPVSKGLGTAVIREDTGETIAVNKSRYVATSYTDAMKPFISALDTSGIDTLGMTVDDRLVDKGARLKRVIEFPNHIIEPEVGDIVRFQIVYFDSYNGLWARHWKVSGMRLWCLNGCVSPRYSVNAYARHTAPAEVEQDMLIAAAEKIVAGLKSFKESEDDFKAMMDVSMSQEAYRHLFQKTIAATPTKDDASKFSSRLMNNLTIGLSNHETLWTVYNAATSWASHDLGRARPEVTAMNRSEKVKDMMESQQWKEFAADVPWKVAS